MLLIALYRIEEGWLFIIIVVEALIYTCDKVLIYARDEALDLLTNMLKSRHTTILVHSCVDTINTRTAREFQEVTQKICRMYVSLVHTSVKFKLSCTIYTCKKQ